MAMGRTFIANIQRQEALSTSRPPTNGPRMNEIPVQAVQLPIALPWAGPEKVEMISANELGTRSAPAMPCKPRKRINEVLLGAAAQSKEAIPKPHSPSFRIRLRP